MHGFGFIVMKSIDVGGAGYRKVLLLLKLIAFCIAVQSLKFAIKIYSAQSAQKSPSHHSIDFVRTVMTESEYWYANLKSIETQAISLRTDFEETCMSEAADAGFQNRLSGPSHISHLTEVGTDPGP